MEYGLSTLSQCHMGMKMELGLVNLSRILWVSKKNNINHELESFHSKLAPKFDEHCVYR